MTTLTSYGQIDEHKQGEIIRALSEPLPDEERMRDFFHTFFHQMVKQK
jgi:hypothetical protein